MCVIRKSDFECTSRQHLLWDRANPFFSAHDVCDFHGFIIEYDRSMIGRKSIRLQEYLIVDFTGLELNTASYEIVKNNGFTFWYFQTYRIFFSFFYSFFSFLDRYMSTMSIIFWWKLEFFLFFFECFKSFTGTKTIIRCPLFAECMKSWSIGIEPFTLNIRSIRSSVSDTLIWSKSKEIMHVKNSIHCTFH